MSAGLSQVVGQGAVQASLDGKPAEADALVLFGATGDLCHKKIFPSLYQLVRHGRLKVPVIGVAKAGWNRDQLVGRVRDSIQKYVKDADPAVVERLVALLQYVDGDYSALDTFRQLRTLLGDARASAALPRHSAQHVSDRGHPAGGG